MQQQPHEYASDLIKQVSVTMRGMDEVIRLCLVALYTDGHVLLEGNPGFGKTELVKTLSAVFRFPFKRIQFTPDLMPQDITGTYMRDVRNPQGQGFTFVKGPIFTSLLLADEINRATPKTQSAMLEAMAERQVTVLGERAPLESPFMVLATQNPIDHEGTYNLPEAQADRFMFKILMPVPNRQVIDEIVDSRTGSKQGRESQNSQNGAETIDPKAKKDYEDLKGLVRQVSPQPALETHIHNIFLASNRRFNELMGLDRQQQARVESLANGLMRYGLGPRAAIALMLGAKAWTLLFLPEADNRAGDRALAHVAIPILRHRIEPALKYEWKSSYSKPAEKDGEQTTGLLEKLLVEFCITTAPAESQNKLYRRGLQAEFEKMTKEGQ